MTVPGDAPRLLYGRGAIGRGSSRPSSNSNSSSRTIIIGNCNISKVQVLQAVVVLVVRCSIVVV